ncbi:hypothetical protein TIFTF001_008969 [Ficus carica]|uniref:Uncharacterized protein n=1 Tax=Ficus carica TaxID=3494 RepID=A0AA87ZP03_FICCA|nr:hypothetical protein TIFTF001_008969 [Ficus carica]
MTPICRSSINEASRKRAVVVVSSCTIVEVHRSPEQPRGPMPSRHRGGLHEALICMSVVVNDGFFVVIGRLAVSNHVSTTTQYPAEGGGYRSATIRYPVGGDTYWLVSRWTLDGNQPITNDWLISSRMLIDNLRI